MHGGIVIESPAGTRAVVDPEALHQWTDRGFKALGPAADPGAEGIVTRDEWADILDARAKLARPVEPTKVKRAAPTESATTQKG